MATGDQPPALTSPAPATAIAAAPTVVIETAPGGKVDPPQ